MRLRLLAAALVLLPALAAGQDAPTAQDLRRDLMEEAGKLLKPGLDFFRRNRLLIVRGRLAELPRDDLADEDWIDLHLVMAAIDRRLNPVPPWSERARPAAEVLDAIPSADRLGEEPDPVTLIDAAAELRRLRAPPGTAPPRGADRKGYRDAAARAEAFARAAEAFALHEDKLTAAAAEVAAESARNLAFDLVGRAHGRVPVGRSRFEWLLERRHGLERSAEDVRRFGERMLAESLANLEAFARGTRSGRTWQELTEQSREDRPATASEFLEYYRRTTQEATEVAAASGLITVPGYARHVEVRFGPAHVPVPYVHYRPGRRDREGIFRAKVVLTPFPDDLPEAALEARLRDRDRHLLRVVCPHEAVPGHHLQFAVASWIESPWRRFGYNSSYTEGWGLYSEELMDRAGFFEDPRSRLAFLRMRLWRAVRVIVDVGLHTGDISPIEALRMLTDVVLMEQWAAEQEVARYLGMPTQPMSYMVGCERIRVMRRAYVALSGPEREFHDRLLGLGPIPLDLAAAALLGKRRAYDAAHP